MSRIRALVYSHGTISTGVFGVQFESERTKLINVPRDINFDRLKELIREKLRLSPYEEITSIVHRVPVNVINGAFIFGRMNVTDDDDLEALFESHISLVSQLPTLTLELYVEVMQSTFDPNSRMLPAPPTVRQMAVENFASSSVYRPEFDPSYFSPRSDSPGGIANIAGCSMGPSSSHQTVGSDDDDEDFAPPSDELQSLSESESLCSSLGDESNEELDDFDEDDMDAASGLRDNDVEDDGADAVPAQPTRSRECPHPAANFFNEINIEAAGDPEWVDETNSNEELRVGKVFQTKEAFKQAVKLFSIRCGRDFTVFKSGKRDEEYRCKYYLKQPHKCSWRIRAAVFRNTRHWTVTRLGDAHTCVRPRENQDHRKLDSDVIASQIVGLVADKPNVPVSQIQHVMLTQFGYQVTYRKAWRAKHKALKIAFGDWESSYASLPAFLQATKDEMPGTIYEIKTKPLDETSVQFHRVFWAFRPCIEAFPHLKPIVQVDGTWLYGKYKQTLLIACSQDGNKKVVPLAFAIVEGETTAAWKFFLSRLRAHVIGNEKQGVCLISDRADGIREAVADARCGWQPPYGYHVFCLRHIASNVKTKYKDKSLKTLVQKIGMLFVTKCIFSALVMIYKSGPDTINAGYQMRREKADSWMRDLELTANDCYNYLPPREKWMQSYDEGRRFGHMTTNLVECINGVFKGFRKLPIIGVVQGSYYRLNRFFVERRLTYDAQRESGKAYSETVTNAMARHIDRASSMRVIEFNMQNFSFEVEEPYNHNSHQIGRKFKVELQARTCDCGEFQAQHYPCVHVVAVCGRRGWDPYEFVDPVFRLDTMLQTYNTSSRPIGDDWPTYNDPIIKPDPARMDSK